MFQAIFREIFALISDQVEKKIHQIGNRAWKLFIALNLFRMAFFLILIGLGFCGFSFYRYLSECLGPNLAPFVVGMLFILLAALLICVSKCLVKNKCKKC